MYKHNPVTEEEKRQWVKWLEGYGIEKFLDAFLRNAQYAQSECVQCGEKIYLDVIEGCGVPDWGTASGDYGCIDSPDTDLDGAGSHVPRTLES